MDQVVSLYKEEIATYQQQVEELKQRNRDCDQKNAALIDKVQTLEDLVEKANVANRDLNIAFEHVHQENLRYQVSADKDALAINHPKQVAESEQRKEELTADSLVWLSEREQFKQRNKFLERECERYNRDNMHLGKQVRHLLKTLEEERGMIIRRQAQVEEESRMTCAADVIDKHLITFESIEELQQQNQKLLSLVKNLSAEQEEREIKIESEEVDRLTKDMEELKSQLDTIKNDRERVLNALNTIHKERDLFKILLCKTRQVEHLTPEIFQRMVSVACSTGPAIAGPDTSSAEHEAHIEDLKRMISKLERNIESIKKELEDSRASAAEELKVKNQLLEKAHLKISEVMKNLEASVERNDFLDTNINSLTSEFDDMRTKCQKMTLELAELNSKVVDVENTNKELSKALETERRRAQDSLSEASQFKEKSDVLLKTIEREKQYRQQELTSLFEDFQSKQSREFEKTSERLLELQQRLNLAHSDTVKMQVQRNFERKRRIRLDKLVYGIPKRTKENVRHTHKFKQTQKRRPTRLSFADQSLSRISLDESSTRPMLAEPILVAPVLAKPAQLETTPAKPVRSEPKQPEAVLIRPVLKRPLLSKPVLAQPVLTKPGLPESALDEPVLAEPVRADPAREEPVREEPVLAEPVRAESVREEPVRAEPVQAEPVLAEPVPAAPVPVEPVFVEPELKEPFVTEPDMAESIMAEPEMDEPVVAKPTMAQPIMDDPIMDEPVIEEPVLAEPVMVEPEMVDHNMTEPVMTEPVFAEPTMVEPVMMETGYGETGPNETSLVEQPSSELTFGEQGLGESGFIKLKRRKFD